MDRVEVKTETKVSNSIQFDRERLLRIFEDAGYNFPANASIKIQVPRGGDYSGCLLDIDSECPLTIGWDEVIDVEFVSPKITHKDGAGGFLNLDNDYGINDPS